MLRVERSGVFCLPRPERGPRQDDDDNSHNDDYDEWYSTVLIFPWDSIMHNISIRHGPENGMPYPTRCTVQHTGAAIFRIRNFIQQYCMTPAYFFIRTISNYPIQIITSSTTSQHTACLPAE